VQRLCQVVTWLCLILKHRPNPKPPTRVAKLGVPMKFFHPLCVQFGTFIYINCIILVHMKIVVTWEVVSNV